MTNLVIEIVLRLAKAGAAAILALLLYVVLVASLAAEPGVMLALLCWLSASAFILLVQESPI